VKSLPAKQAHEAKQVLSAAEEAAIGTWIKKWDAFGFPSRRRHVYQMVQGLLRSRNSSDNLGDHRLQRFLRRHPHLDSKVGKTLDKERALAMDLDSFKIHLDRFYHIKCKFHVSNENTWNTNEKGFTIGIGGAGVLVCRASRRNPSIIQDGGREWITVVKAISGEGKVLAPLIIFKTGAHLMGHHTHIEIKEKEDAYFSTSSKGYTNTEITFKWFQEVFEPSTRLANGIEDHCILLLDGHSAHVENYDFINHAINHNIHLICLPSHATHVLQPLDVSSFGPLSTYYKQELEDRVCQLGPYGKIKKGDVFPMLQRARLTTFTKDNILSARRACGLIPFSRERILNDPVLQAKMAPRTLLSARRPGLRLVSSHLDTAPDLDKIEVEDKNIPLTPANQSVKELLSRCIKQARLSDAEKTITEEEAHAAKHLLKPAKADRWQLPGGLLLDFKQLAKLYRKREEQDKKKAEAAQKCQAKRSATKSTIAAGSKRRKVSKRQRELDQESNGGRF